MDRLSHEDLIELVMEHTALDYYAAEDVVTEMVSTMCEYILGEAMYDTLQEIANEFIFSEVTVYTENGKVYFTRGVEEC